MRLLLLVGLATLGLAGCGLCGCADLAPSSTDSNMTAPITDTAAIYQVHGIRFAVPEGLAPATDRYVLTDLEPDAWPELTPHNKITLFTDTRPPQEILDGYMSASDGIHDGPYLHNLRRQRIGDRMFTRASITYTPYSRLYPDEVEDRVRIDYAFTVDDASGQTWGFRLVPPDTSLTPEVAQDWLDMLTSVAPTRTRPASPDVSPRRIGFDTRQGQRLFHTPWYTIHVPASWRTMNAFFFELEGRPSQERLRAKNIDAIKTAHVSVSTSFVPYDEEERTMEDVQNLFDRFGNEGSDIAEMRTLDGYPVEWTEIGFGYESESRVETAFITAVILMNKNQQDGQHVELKSMFQYTKRTVTEESEPPEARDEIMEKYLQLYDSIEIGHP